MIPYVYEDLCEGASMGCCGAGNEMTWRWEDKQMLKRCCGSEEMRSWKHRSAAANQERDERVRAV